MPDEADLRGVLHAGAAAPVAIRVLPDRVEARPDGGAPVHVLLAEASVRPGGFDGAHVFVRSADEAITIASDDPRFVPALEAVADARLRERLALVVRHHRGHVRRTLVERWAWRLRWVLLLCVVALALAALLTWLGWPG